MSNPQSELFKELSSNELFKKYLDQLNEYDENVVLLNALNDDDLMTKLKSILDDDEMIKTKMQIKINQVNKCKPKDETIVNFIPYTENGITYLTPTIKIERVGFNMKMTTPDFEIIY